MNVISKIGRGGSAYSWKYFLKCCLCEVFSSCFICTNIASAERETMFGNRGKRNHCEIAFIFTYLISERRLSSLKMILRVSCFRLSQWSSTWLWSKYFSEIWSLTAYLEMTLCLSKKIRSKKFICIMFVNLCILFSFYLAWFVCVFICMFNLSMCNCNFPYLIEKCPGMEGQK